MAKRERKKKTGALFSRSKIVGFFVKIASYLFDKTEDSITGKIFSSYNEKFFEKGFLYGLIRKLKLDEVFIRPLKRTISKYVSSSLLVNKFNEYLQGFLFTKLNVYGLLFMTTGIGFMLVSVLKLYINQISSLSFFDTFISALLVLISIPLLISSRNLSSAVCNSKRASDLLFEKLGCKRETFEKDRGIAGHTRMALPLAFFFMLLSWWIRPVYIVMLSVLFILALMVFFSPESGIVILICILPFLKFEYLLYFTMYILFSFLLKYIRGKRTIKLDFLGGSVIIFLLIVLSGYFVASANMQSKAMMMQMLCSVCIFFLIVNLIKSKKWIKRCVNAVCFACILCSVYGIIGFIQSKVDIPYLDALLYNRTFGSMISYFKQVTHLAAYLLLALPLVFVNLKSEYKKQRLGNFAVLITGLVCLGVIQSVKPVVCLLLGFSVIFMLYSKKSLAFYLFALCFIPALYFVLRPILSDNFVIFEKLSDIASANMNNLVQFIKSGGVLLGVGIGKGEIAFGGDISIFNRIMVEAGLIGIIWFILVLFLFVQKSTTYYSKGCSSYGRLNSLATLSAVFSTLLMGVNANIFQDYRVGFMFWLCMALGSCVCHSEKNTIYTDEFDI